MSKQVSRFERDGGAEVLHGRFEVVRRAEQRALAAIEQQVGPEISSYDQQVALAQQQSTPAETQPAAAYPDVVLERANRLAQSADAQNAAIYNPLFGEHTSPSQDSIEQKVEEFWGEAA